MRILMVSDTHGRDGNFDTVWEMEKDSVDAIIHCGDVEGSEDYIRALVECPVYMVSGNNDFFSDLPREIEAMIGGHRFFISHGHYYGVAMDLEHIWEEGYSRQARVVAFGHTHRPLIKNRGGITIVNPGSLSFPRQQGRRPTYMTIDCHANGDMDFEIHEL